MLDFLIIFAAALAGFVHAPLSIVVIAAGGLLAMSYWRHQPIYARGQEIGLTALMRFVAWRSATQAMTACACAYGGAVVIRLLSQS